MMVLHGGSACITYGDRICKNSHFSFHQASDLRLRDLPPSSPVIDLCRLSAKYNVRKLIWNGFLVNLWFET